MNISITTCHFFNNFKHHFYKAKISYRHFVFQNNAMFQKDIIKKGWMSASIYSFGIQSCKGALVTFHMTLVGFYHAAEDGHNNKVKMYVVCVFRCRQEMKSLSQHEQKILSTCFLYFQIFKFEASNCQTIRSIHIISWEEIKRYLTITTKDKKSDWQGVEIWNPYEKFFAASFFSILLRRYL